MSVSNSPASLPEPAAAVDSSSGFSSVGDLLALVALGYGILFFTIFLVLGVVVAAGFLSNRRRRRQPEVEEEEYDPWKAEAERAVMQMPTVIFSAATTKLNGFAAECSICLTEFAEGDALQVLPACGHGFHRRCVDRWLAAKWSCPNCRRACGGAQPYCSPDEAPPV